MTFPPTRPPAALVLPTFFLLAAVLLAGCSGTRVVSQWRDPQVASPVFTKLFVVVPDPSAADRRIAEDALVAALAPTPAEVSYRALPEAADIADRARVMTAAKAAAADGALFMRVVADDTVLIYEAGPGPWVGPLPGRRHPYPVHYYGRPPFGWGPEYIDSRRLLTLETSAYRVADGVLAWTIVTRTSEPIDTAQLVRETLATLREHWPR